MQLPGEHFAAAAPDRLITFRVFQQPYHTVILTHPHKVKHKALGESKRRDHIYNEIITTNITPFEPSKANLGHHIIRTDRLCMCVCVGTPSRSAISKLAEDFRSPAVQQSARPRHSYLLPANGAMRQTPIAAPTDAHGVICDGDTVSVHKICLIITARLRLISHCANRATGSFIPPSGTRGRRRASGRSA